MQACGDESRDYGDSGGASGFMGLASWDGVMGDNQTRTIWCPRGPKRVGAGCVHSKHVKKRAAPTSLPSCSANFGSSNEREGATASDINALPWLRSRPRLNLAEGSNSMMGLGVQNKVVR
jgi:hypothetical protein